MSKIEEYYFEPGKVEERNAEEDEWEGSMVNTELLDEIAELDPFWAEVWLHVARKAHVTFQPSSNYYDDQSSKVATISWSEDIGKLPEIREITTKEPFWNCSTNQANERGWEWSGDTDVYVKIISAKNMVEACTKALLAWTSNHLADLEIHPNQCSLLRPNSWDEFWRTAIGYNNDLPTNGPPPSDAARLYYSGNESISIACLDKMDNEGNKLYYIAQFYTS